MADTTNRMDALYRKLERLGYPTAYVRETILPDWWDDDAAKTESGFAEAAIYVARHTGLSLGVLYSADEAT